jgi:hypothetical protein
LPTPAPAGGGCFEISWQPPDGGDTADGRGSFFDSRAYPDRPGPRAPLSGERYFNAQHAKERLPTTQPAERGRRIFWPIGDILACNTAGGS